MQIEFAQKIVDPSEMFSLREIDPEALAKAAAKCAKADPMTVIDHQETGAFDYYAVLSHEKVYEVLRMGLFAKCNCKNFTMGHEACKHIAASLPPLCRTCLKRNAPELGGQCEICGPGALLPVGTQFRMPRYWGAKALFEVMALEGDEVVCHDMTEPVNARFPDRTNHRFPLSILDNYRRQGTLLIVESTAMELAA